MKKYFVATVFAAFTLSLSAWSDPAQQHGGGHDQHGPQNHGPQNNEHRPQTQPHPTVVRPSGPVSTGDHRQTNIPRPEINGGRGGRPDGRTRPVHIDPRPRDQIRHDVFTQHFRPGVREDWRPNGWVSDRDWHEFHRDRWFIYPPGFAWENVIAVTCQARFVSSNPADADNGQIYTADSTLSDWGRPAWASETIVANQTVSEALDECYAANADYGACEPVESTDDVDGCFVTYEN